MDSGWCLCCFNCCFFNCFTSFHLALYQIITSLIGIAANSAIIILSKRLMDKSIIIFSTQVINITYYASGTVLSSILLFFKKLEKLNQGCFYKFGWLSSKIYSICSKILTIINIIGFFYLISFTPFLTSSFEGEKLFNQTLFEHIGDEIEVFLRYKNDTFHCGNFKGNFTCISDDYTYKGEDESNWADIFLFIFYSLLSGLIMFFNGESFSSDSKRIKNLSFGKLLLELKPIEVVNSICTRKKSCDLLNLLFCYKATVFNIEALISAFSFIIFAFSICLIILLSKFLPIQRHFISIFIVLIPMVISIFCFLLGMCCENCLCKNRRPCCKKVCAVIAVIIAIVYLPFDLFGIIETVGVLNGKVKFRADCKEYVIYKLDYDDLYRSICHEDYNNKYLLITLKGCSFKYILFTFIASMIGVILIFYLIVLILSYIRRGVPEYGFKNRAYDALMYLIGDNGEKICVEDIKIEKETKTITSKKDGKEIEYKRDIYKRIVTQREIPVLLNLPVVYLNN